MNLAYRILIVLALLATTTAGGYALGHRQATQAHEAAQAKAEAASLSRALRQLARAGRAMARIGEQLRDAMQSSHERERIVVKTVTEVVRENPEFAAVRRPPELDRVRREQLQAIADATARVPR